MIPQKNMSTKISQTVGCFIPFTKDMLYIHLLVQWKHTSNIHNQAMESIYYVIAAIFKDLNSTQAIYL